MHKELITTLEQLIDTHKQLVHLADQKTGILIERLVDDLTELIRKEEETVVELSRIEQERENLISSYGEGSSSFSLRDYIEQVEDDLVKNKLQELQTTLYEIMIELKEKNEQNEILLQDAIHFTNHMIDQITKSKQQQMNYQPPTRKPSAPMERSGFFDTKA